MRILIFTSKELTESAPETQLASPMAKEMEDKSSYEQKHETAYNSPGNSTCVALSRRRGR